MTPPPAPGFAGAEFGKELDHPRWLHALPNGDVLVAESNRPPRPDNGFSPRVAGGFNRRMRHSASAP